MKLYVVVGIGCLECDIDSHILGVFEKKEDAMKALNKYPGSSQWAPELFETELNVFNKVK